MRQIKQIIVLMFFAMFCMHLQAQTLSECKTKVSNFGVNPKNKAPKKVYINSFNILVEVYREDVDFKDKRSFRGKGRGAATAQAALGLKGVNTEMLQQKADQLYSEFLKDLTSKGFEIMGSDEAKSAKYFDKYVAFSGPMVRESANPGMLEIIPSDFSGFTSTKNASGNESKKSGLFSGVKGLGKLAKNTNMLSNQLDDAIVIDVNLALTWSEAGGSWLKSLSGANAKIKTNLALGEKSVTAPNENGKSKGREDVYNLPNDFTVAQGSGLRKVTWTGNLKKPIFIDGVIDDTKVESNNKGDASKTYDVGNLYRVTEWTSSISSNAKFVEVDGEKLSEALYLSGKAFIQDQLNYFYDKYD